jgi:hypothetical protein
VAVAANCCVAPAVMLAVPGDTEISVSVLAVVVEVGEPTQRNECKQRTGNETSKQTSGVRHYVLLAMADEG